MWLEIGVGQAGEKAMISDPSTSWEHTVPEDRAARPSSRNTPRQNRR